MRGSHKADIVFYRQQSHTVGAKGIKDTEEHRKKERGTEKKTEEKIALPKQQHKAQ